MTSDSSIVDDARRALYAGSLATFVERRKELADVSRRSDAAGSGALTEALDEPGFDDFTIAPATRAPLPRGSVRKKAPPITEVAVDRAEEAAAQTRISARAELDELTARVSEAADRSPRVPR